MPDAARAAAVVAPPIPQPMITTFSFLTHGSIGSSRFLAKVATLPLPIVLAPLVPTTRLLMGHVAPGQRTNLEKIGYRGVAKAPDRRPNR
jgi:hypothetical protein